MIGRVFKGMASEDSLDHLFQGDGNKNLSRKSSFDPAVVMDLYTKRPLVSHYLVATINSDY